ncbi:MAG TPA: ATP-binding protein [Pseudonocardiaceae bacterium]|nr:ATP-binding protein [Pseudonocardiaceae bacterium]
MAPTNDHDNHPASAGHLSAGRVRAELVLTLAADWVSPSLARARMRDWLRAHRWPASAVQDLVLAVSEAVSNSIEHGYDVPVDDLRTHAVTIDLHARFTSDGDGFSRVYVEVRDRGVWRPPAGAPSNRGRGLIIMRACVDRLVVDQSPDGTVVSMTSRPVPMPPGV